MKKPTTILKESVSEDLAVIQRCQIHKLRNLRSYLPKSRHAYVLQTMKEAYKCKSADKARKRLQALVSWLERNGYDEAAGSLREGMEETLTVVKLALPALLRQSLATTNAIENLNGTIRRVSRNGMCPEVRGKRTAPSTRSSGYQIRRQPPRVREPRSD